MRKILYLITVFFLFLFSSCKNFEANYQEEIISISLPLWPPENIITTRYPELYGWKITITSEKYSVVCFYSPKTEQIKTTPPLPSPRQQGITIKGNKITLLVQQDMPLSISATPITLTPAKDKILFFKQAGFIYPYEKTNKLTWEDGFISSLMETLFKADAKGKENAKSFIRSFNWLKASEIIKEKIQIGHFNPWLLNRENILNKISQGSFSSIYLDLSSIYLINNTTLNSNDRFISSFIPENKFNEILVKKSQPQLFMTEPNYGATITYNSSKNVSLEYCFLPIFIEGL